MATRKNNLIAQLVVLGYLESDMKKMKINQLQQLLQNEKSVSLAAVSNENDKTKEVVAEFTQQLLSNHKFIYNSQYKEATLVIENLGYGDIYVSEQSDVSVGQEFQRIIFKEIREFQASKLFMISNSQPVVSIIEVK